MSHSQDHSWGETESPSKGNREPLLGSKEEKGTAQSLSQRSSWFVWRMSPVGREAGLGAKKVMSQENRAACHREDQQDHGGELGKEGGGTVHDKASNPWFPRWENGRNSSHLSEGLRRSEMHVGPQPRTCAQELSVTVSPSPPCPLEHRQQTLPSEVPLLTPCPQ